MKKRLLSAALALAMVLTMLPLSAMPAFAADEIGETDILGNGTESVSYVSMPDATHDEKGWYVTVQKEVEKDGKKTTISKELKVTSGAMVSSKYYEVGKINSTNMATDYKNNTLTTPEGIYNVKDNQITGLKSTTIQVIGGTFEIDAHGASSLSVDVYQGTAKIKDSGVTNADGSKTLKLTTINVTNSKKDFPSASDPNGSNDPSVVLDDGVGTIGEKTDTRAMKVTLSGVKSESEINWSGANVSRSLILNNATIGDVTMSGVLTGDQTKQTGQTVTVNNKSTSYANVDNSIGNIALTGNGSKITLGDVKVTTAPTVTLKGTGTSLTLNGNTEVGTVSLQGAVAGDLAANTKTTSAAPPSVTINKGTKAASIGLDSHTAELEKSTGKYTVKVYGEVGAVTLTGMAADIDVGDTSAGAKTGGITIGSGTVDISGSYGEVGNVTVLKNATVTLTSNAKNYTVGALIVDNGGDAKTCEFNVPNEPSNTLTNVTGYNKKTIKGGTWKNALAATLLQDLAYQLHNTTYTYYTVDQLGEALTAQSATTGKLTPVGAGSDTRTITFKDGAVVFGVLTQDGVGAIKMPTEVNGTRVAKWSDGKFLTNGGEDYTPPATGDVTLDAQGSLLGSVVTKLDNVTIREGKKDAQGDVIYGLASITAQVKGTVITLSGAVTSGMHDYMLDFETDAVAEDPDHAGQEVPVTLMVYLTYNADTGSLTFANRNTTDLGYGVMQEGFSAIVLSNGTRYTLDGSGLKVLSEYLKIPNITKSNGQNLDAIRDYNHIEVTVTAPGFSTNEAKKAVADLLSGSTCSFVFQNSPVMQKAINAVQAGITDKQVEDWITAANRQAWTDNTRATYNKDEAAKINYDEVWLVPFLKITVTDYKPNGSITMSMTPSYRIEVRKSAPDAAQLKYVVKANEGKFYSPSASGNALTLSNDDLTGGTANPNMGVSVKFSGLSATVFKYMHQDGTYVYESSNGMFSIIHAGDSGLGTVVINNTKAYVTLKESVNGNQKGVFDTLQAAVDASEDNNYIVVDPGYKSTESITVTGKPRTIKVETSTILTIANASGGLVDVDKTGGGKIYTITLNREVAAVENTSITVSSNSNGTTTVSTNSARPGATVTITATPKSGYQASTPTVTTNTGASVTVSGSNGTYTFVVPAGATSITVRPNYVLSTGLPFTDVTDDKAWYFNGVKYCYETVRNGYRLMQGYSDDEFGPSRPLTRADMVTILWNINGCPTPGAATKTYRDVPSNKWYYNAITWATNNGYADGYGDGRFGPENYVQRDELVEFLWKYENRPTGSGNLNAYSDGSSVPQWAQASMRWAVGFNILSGQSSVSLGNRIAAEEDALRCQVAVTVMLYDKVY